MSISSYQRSLQDYSERLARLQRDKSQEASRVADETKHAYDAADRANRATNPSSRQSYLRDAQRHHEKAASHQKKIASIESDIAREQGRLLDAQKNLRRAEQQADEQAARDRQRQAREEERMARKREERMRDMAGQLTEHAQLHSVAFAAIEEMQRLPQVITVLFLAANPVDEAPLRLDEEVRAIGEMIRKSANRDSVRLESRWAVRPLDVLQAINECNPRIVHFSGHGSSADEIIFQDNSGNAKPVSKAAIVQTMAAGSSGIQLVFFNTCYSRAQAEAVVDHVAAAIGMNSSIGDEAARVFSAQFYSAIGFGHSVGKAFAQTKAALMLEDIPEESTPELFVTAGLEADALVLVQP